MADVMMRVMTAVAFAVLMQLFGAVGPLEFMSFAGETAACGKCQQPVNEFHRRVL
jgi:hypothetical protein